MPRNSAPNRASSDKPRVEAFTDGACLGNPGAGGYGVILRYNGHEKELAGGYRRTTNNRMEIMAAIRALEELTRPCRVTIYTDSQYLADAMTKGWVERWRRKGWMRSARSPAKNSDLWRLLQQLAARHDVDFVWVRGHAGHAENERADQLSVRAAHGPNLAIDTAYENGQAAGQGPQRLPAM